MLYLYECEKCGHQQSEMHGMSEDPKIKCEECNKKCFRVIQPVEINVRGNCYLNKKDCKKQANLALMQENDPYAKHRVPGERDDLISKIKNKDKNRVMAAVKSHKPKKKKKK